VAHFYSHWELALRASATTAVDGRLRGVASVVIADMDHPSQQVTAAPGFELFGPGDVHRLAAGAITRRFPAPHAGNAEVTKLALVEFAAADLPWRYTPQRPAGGVLRPWLVLVVGRRRADEIVLRPDGRVTLGVGIQANHALSGSHRWAHVHLVDGREVARLLAPVVTRPNPAEPASVEYGYLPQTEYVACVVPAFTAAGEDVWNGSAAVTCPLYDWWTFRTGPGGDFRDLARKLKRADLVQHPGGKPFGRADVAYRTRSIPPTTMTIAGSGALRLPFDPPDAALPAPIVGETAALARRIVTPDGRRVVTAPRYDAPFTDANAPETPPVGGWADQLRSDPRLRGAAGLGAWAAIEWQDRIADAAAVKAGDLAIASERIRHVAFGVEVSRSLWRRRLPAAPADRLAVLLPALGRLLTTDGRSAADQLAGRTPQLSRALLSSAARRAFRPGPARAALAADARPTFGAVLQAANQCAEEPDAGAIRSGGWADTSDLKRAVHEAASNNPRLADSILQHLGPNPSPGAIAAALRALEPGADGRPNHDAIARFLDARDFPAVDRTIVGWDQWMREHAEPERCHPVDLEELATRVAAAIDPTVARPPAVERVLATLPGFTHVGPVEIEPELDLPLWSFLSDRSPDWMLPGAGALNDGDVVGLATNPAFVQALLVGANHQTSAELRWRNIPMVSRWSPLRKFWQRKADPTGMDINPIRGWPTADPLGSSSLVPPGLAVEAVVAFRTTLFRRYPATVVYLYRDLSGDWTPSATAPLPSPDRIDPSFTGTIGPDITFFGFNLEPTELTKYWVVLEEPPSGYRFRHAADLPGPEPDPDGAKFGYRRFAVPVRVLIGKLLDPPS
jgi:hypothetical protein